jgi:hypothetical protein
MTPHLFLSLAATSLLLLCSCERRTHIVYIVPVGFRGVAAIGERHAGIAPKTTFTGAIAFEIPPGGILAVSDASAFQRWHTFEARYADGRKLSIYPIEQSPTDPKRVMFFEMDAAGDKTWYFFVGTDAEIDSARKASRPEIPK